MATHLNITHRRRLIDGFLLSARRQGFVTVQQVLLDLGEDPEAWADIESGSYPLADLEALVDLPRERERGPPPGISEWAIAMAAAPLQVQEIERWFTRARYTSSLSTS